MQNRLQSTIQNLSIAHENLSAANSRIRDADVAAETAELTRNSILMQAGVSVLGQANQMQQVALKLLVEVGYDDASTRMVDAFYLLSGDGHWPVDGPVSLECSRYIFTSRRVDRAGNTKTDSRSVANCLRPREMHPFEILGRTTHVIEIELSVDDEGTGTAHQTSIPFSDLPGNHRLLGLRFQTNPSELVA